MCGICGVVGRCQRKVVEKMTTALIHRGPDSHGFHWSEDVKLGMRRLKIIDVDGSEQPVYNEDGSIVLVCNGEIYNYKSLRIQLKERGHVFKTSGDIETIIHLYEEFGEDCVKYLDGMFAFAIWDSADSRLLLARDRLGVKPLYYAKSPNKLVFASEIRSIMASGEIPMVMDETALISYVSFPAIPAPLTIFQQ
ncbi:asparagine synthetase B, partial [bacterium]|nr:asparagine synthetase B [bacterium]